MVFTSWFLLLKSRPLYTSNQHKISKEILHELLFCKVKAQAKHVSRQADRSSPVCSENMYEVLVSSLWLRMASCLWRLESVKIFSTSMSSPYSSIVVPGFGEIPRSSLIRKLCTIAPTTTYSTPSAFVQNETEELSCMICWIFSWSTCNSNRWGEPALQY